MRLGIAGLGVVAQSTINLIRKNQSELTEIAGQPIELQAIASRRLRDEIDLQGIEFSTDLTQLVKHPEVDVVVELIGGTDAAYDLIAESLRQGKGVVSANKAVISEYGNELIELANQQGVSLAFEAAVAGGIPIIAALKTEFPANDIQWIAGIINGTCNFILTAMSQKGASFEDALAEAQRLGYAEADPTFDVGGIDAAQKLSILAALAFKTPIDGDSIYCQGISGVTSEDISHADELGFAIKHVAVAKRSANQQALHVNPALIPHSNLLAKVDDVENAVQVGTASAGVLRFMGPGAGGDATASSVINDVINIARDQYRPTRLSGERLTHQAITEIVSAHYLNIAAADKPGVIAVIGETLARHNISIASMIQKQEQAHPESEGTIIPVIILTNEVPYRELQAAIDELENLADIAGKIRNIRVANFD